MPSQSDMSDMNDEEQTPNNETVANLTVRIYANDVLVAESENKALWGYVLAKIISEEHKAKA